MLMVYPDPGKGKDQNLEGNNRNWPKVPDVFTDLMTPVKATQEERRIVK